MRYRAVASPVRRSAADLPCGGQLWGPGGQLLGYVTYAYRRDDGRSLTMLPASGKGDGFISFAAATGAAYCLT